MKLHKIKLDVYEWIVVICTALTAVICIDLVFFGGI